MIKHKQIFIFRKAALKRRVYDTIQISCLQYCLPNWLNKQIIGFDQLSEHRRFSSSFQLALNEASWYWRLDYSLYISCRPRRTWVTFPFPPFKTGRPINVGGFKVGSILGRKYSITGNHPSKPIYFLFILITLCLIRERTD